MNFGGSVLNPFRRKMGMAFRKSLGVFHYKIGHQQYHKKPGVIPLYIKEKLKKDRSMQTKHKISEMERNSPYPYGKFIGNKFVFDEKRMPFFNVPDLTGFTLKPYVSVHTPKIEKKQLEYVHKLNDFTLKENFGRFVEESTLEKAKRLQLTEKAEEKKSKKEEKTKEKVEATK